MAPTKSHAGRRRSETSTEEERRWEDGRDIRTQNTPKSERVGVIGTISEGDILENTYRARK